MQMILKRTYETGSKDDALRNGRLIAGWPFRLASRVFYSPDLARTRGASAL